MIDWLKGYPRDWLRPDVIAGLTTAAVVIPKAMAYATIAGLPVQVGLYTAFLPMLIYALTGSSRPLSVSTSTTLAILMGAQLTLLVPDGDAGALQRASATLALMVGAILLLAAALRLGFVANFISEPVLTGFKAGIGVVIVADQVPKLLGIHFPKGPFFANLLSIVEGIPGTSVPTLCVALAMIALLFALEHWTPRAPAPLVAVAAGIGGMALLGLSSLGVEAVGDIPRGLPSLTLPDASLLATLWPGAAGIALMSFTETIAAGRAFAQSGEPAPRPNRELFATGLANAGGALMGAMAAGGGTTQTAVNRLAGARTQAAEIVTAAASLVTMLFLAPVIALMPQATLAAVVIVYSIGLIRPGEFLAIRRIRRMEFRWALVAFAGVVLLGTLKGILVAIVVSLVSLIHHASNPEVQVLGRKRSTNVFRPVSDEHGDDETFPGLLMLRLQGTIFFANVGTLEGKLRPLIERADPKVVAVDFSGVPDLEYTALKLLIDAEARERERGVSVWLVALTPKMLEMVQRSPLGATLGRERLHFNMETAVAHYLRNRVKSDGSKFTSCEDLHMLPPKLAALYGEMEKVRGETLSALSGLTEEEFSRKVGEEWSAAQILHHIVMAETGTSKVIRKSIKTAAGTLPPYPADDSGLAVRALPKPVGAYQAPEAVRPEDPPGKNDLLRLARETREQTAASFAMLAAVDPRAATFPHPLFGDLDLYEWPLVNVLLHERGHQDQIRTLLARMRG